MSFFISLSPVVSFLLLPLPPSLLPFPDLLPIRLSPYVSPCLQIRHQVLSRNRAKLYT